MTPEGELLGETEQHLRHEVKRLVKDASATMLPAMNRVSDWFQYFTLPDVLKSRDHRRNFVRGPRAAEEVALTLGATRGTQLVQLFERLHTLCGGLYTEACTQASHRSYD
jgi:hypothetical protein